MKVNRYRSGSPGYCFFLPFFVHIIPLAQAVRRLRGRARRDNRALRQRGEAWWSRRLSQSQLYWRRHFLHIRKYGPEVLPTMGWKAGPPAAAASAASPPPIAACLSVRRPGSPICTTIARWWWRSTTVDPSRTAVLSMFRPRRPITSASVRPGSPRCGSKLCVDGDVAGAGRILLKVRRLSRIRESAPPRPPPGKMLTIGWNEEQFW